MTAHVIGAATAPFRKPGEHEPYPAMAAAAARAALADAGVDYRDVDQAIAGYCLGDSASGQRALYQLGLTGIPIVNVSNNCSTGSTAIWLARQAIQAGAARTVLVVGFEEMEKRPTGTRYLEWASPIERHALLVDELLGPDPAVPFAPRLFAAAGREHSERHGTKPETFAKVSVKARRHAAKNPNAVFREELTLQQVLASPVVAAPLTRFQCCPMTCGAAAVVLSAGPRGKRSVEILGQAVRTDGPATFDGSAMELAGCGMTAAAARAAYEEAGLGPDEVDVVELHDCFTTNEIIAYEALGLCGEGEAERLVEDGDNSYGGRMVVNPSGGLLGRGHPLGATGVAQCVELVQQLRGEAGPRQVEGARIGLQQNIGLGGAAVVTVYRGAS